ncbi:UNVERIFIED_CONTAM: hypothetical protein NCL1_21989 [Trichonephila clavipes]
MHGVWGDVSITNPVLSREGLSSTFILLFSRRLGKNYSYYWYFSVIAFFPYSGNERVKRHHVLPMKEASSHFTEQKDTKITTKKVSSQPPYEKVHPYAYVDINPPQKTPEVSIVL